MRFLTLLAALGALILCSEAALLRETAQDIYSGEETGAICLNGGISSAYQYSNKHFVCHCPRDFSGKNCEIETSAKCYNGNGQNYRGTVSKSQTGKDCLEWDYESLEILYQADALTLGLGNHNYCRNPNGDRKPWCHVRQGFKIVREHCQIQPCASKLTPLCEIAPAAATCGKREQKLFKIVGGKVTAIESQPWTGAIFQRSRTSEFFTCGGSLIASCWLVTAAHCFPNGASTDPNRYSIFLGKGAINETDSRKEQKFQVEKIIIHPAFDDSQGNYNNDIALVKMRSRSGQCAVESRAVKTVCLPPQNRMLPAGSTCEIVGYGRERESLWYYSNYLREARVQLLPQSVCSSEQYYGTMLTGNMFCAGGSDWTVDSCKGDSGGPLVCEVDHRMYLFGIVSWGEGCARKYRPGVYTKVTNYNQWIAEQTGMQAMAAGAVYPQK
uniref:Urokinase-type plasminogen activator n=1 Tax=Lepisosteus oculatus TaxID=7918 RepID=W5MAD4_LEPOC